MYQFEKRNFFKLVRARELISLLWCSQYREFLSLQPGNWCISKICMYVCISIYGKKVYYIIMRHIFIFIFLFRPFHYTHFNLNAISLYISFEGDTIPVSLSTLFHCYDIYSPKTAELCHF